MESVQSEQEIRAERNLQSYVDSIEKLQQSGAKFMVERSQQVRSGEHVKEFDWQIAGVSKDAVGVTKTNPHPTGDHDRFMLKFIPLEQFAELQTEWLASVDQCLDQTIGKPTMSSQRDRKEQLRQQQNMRAKLYQQERVTPELLEVRHVHLKHLLTNEPVEQELR